MLHFVRWLPYIVLVGVLTVRVVAFPSASEGLVAAQDERDEAPTEAATALGHCGTERWPVKTLADQNAAQVRLTPLPATIQQLRAIPAPNSSLLPQDGRVIPDELQVYTL